MTVIVIVVVAVIVTFIATSVSHDRGHVCARRAEASSGPSWWERTLGRLRRAPPQRGEHGVLTRLRELLDESARTRETSTRARGTVLETEARLRAAPRHDTGRRDRPVRAQPRLTKRKRGDVVERQRKLRSEERCREILERIFDAPFPKRRPAWLRNDERGTGTGHKLELDCYNEELGLALEYNGRQHRVYPNTWHESKRDFDEQRRRDRLKVVRCMEEGIALIVVPDDEIVPYEELYTFITERLEQLGILEFED